LYVFREDAITTPHALYWLFHGLGKEQGAEWGRFLKVKSQPLWKVGLTMPASDKNKKHKLWLIGMDVNTHELWLRHSSHR
jgi:hypothetical protein